MAFGALAVGSSRAFALSGESQRQTPAFQRLKVNARTPSPVSKASHPEQGTTVVTIMTPASVRRHGRRCEVPADAGTTQLFCTGSHNWLASECNPQRRGLTIRQSMSPTDGRGSRCGCREDRTVVLWASGSIVTTVSIDDGHITLPAASVESRPVTGTASHPASSNFRSSNFRSCLKQSTALSLSGRVTVT